MAENGRMCENSQCACWLVGLPSCKTKVERASLPCSPVISPECLLQRQPDAFFRLGLRDPRDTCVFTTRGLKA